MMKFMVLILVVANAILSSQSVHGAECNFVGYYACATSGTGAMPAGTTMANNYADGNDHCAYSECKVYTGLDGKYYAVASCSDVSTGRNGVYSCNGNPTPVTVTAGGCSMTYISCQCATCMRCASTSWTAYGTGYETMTEAQCDCNGTCTQTTKYRCAANYYGSTANGASGCNPCTKGPNGEATYSPAGSTTQTSCYIAKDTQFSDSTGSAVWTAQCNYSN